MNRRRYLRRVVDRLRIMRMHLPPFLMRWYEKYMFEDMLSKHRWTGARKGFTPRKTPETVEQLDGTMVRIKNGEGLGKGQWVRLDSLPLEQQRLILEMREKRAKEQKRK